jgi:glycosyltransferase involved in cell wall biosynthesis
VQIIKQPLLTIAVPTYNRSDLLCQLLSNIDKQYLDIDSNLVEVLVQDNHSVDGTVNKVYGLSKALNYHVRVRENSENLGYDRNIIEILRNARGKFVLLIADDDQFEELSLSKIVDWISNHLDSGVILFENSFYDSTMTYNANFREEFFKEIGDSQQFSNSFELLRGLSAEVFGGVSGVCIKRNLLNFKILESYTGSHWIHLAAWLDVGRVHPISVYCEPVIRYRLDNKELRWSDLDTSLGMQKVLLQNQDLLTASFPSSFAKYRSMSRTAIIKESPLGLKHGIEVLLNLLRSLDLKALDTWLVDFPLLLLAVGLPQSFLLKLLKFRKLLSN